MVKVTPHFGQRTLFVLTRSNSAGGIRYPQLEQGVARDASTFSRLIFSGRASGDSTAEIPVDVR